MAGFFYFILRKVIAQAALLSKIRYLKKQINFTFAFYSLFTAVFSLKIREFKKSNTLLVTFSKTPNMQYILSKSLCFIS